MVRYAVPVLTDVGDVVASLRTEFHNYTAYLQTLDVPDDVRRMTHVIADNLEHLAEVGAARRARSNRLAPLAIEYLASAPARPIAPTLPASQTSQIGRLHELRVGPFRGFMRPEAFDLSHDITFVYGANGTGKSSFCEALEAAMLGSISEAQAKRIELRAYCDNVRVNRHERPDLTATQDSSPPATVYPNEADFRFCFVEKCRIDDFARIAARTPADQRQLIATLFGVDAFVEFVRGFNATLDESLVLVGPRALQLQSARTHLSTSQQIINDYSAREAALLQGNRQLAERIVPGQTYQHCKNWLMGSQEAAGRLPWVQSQLDNPPPVVHGVSPDRITNALALAHQTYAAWQATSSQLTARAGELSYAKLYEAVLELSTGATVCPACTTDLRHVSADPFARAQAGLQHLSEVATLQNEERINRQAVDDSMRALLDEMSRTIRAGRVVCPSQLDAGSLPALPDSNLGSWLDPWMQGTAPPWTTLLSIAESIRQSDAAAQEVLASRTLMVAERDRLAAFKTEVERQDTLFEAAIQDVQAARRQIQTFEEDNRNLMFEVAAEAEQVAYHNRIKNAYDAFLINLQGYAGALPATLLQGLAEEARNLYNSFNRGDPPGDLLHALHLPLAENGKIQVEFVGEVGVRYDALGMLSEGHIKCLGLAILVAKNVSLSANVIIFDDIVNAIDDDHRDGIWRTLFEDGYLVGKQIILTSHAEEFLHRIQQELGSAAAARIKRYRFLPHSGDHELRVDTDPPQKNYVLLASEAIAHDEKREALRNARPALESLTDRLWRWLGKNGDARLDIRFSGPNGHLELNNKCVKLRQALRRISSPPDALAGILQALDRLLQRDGNSIEWQYLNGGVHDSTQQHEWDREAVRAIVAAVGEMDGALDVLQSRSN